MRTLPLAALAAAAALTITACDPATDDSPTATDGTTQLEARLQCEKLITDTRLTDPAGATFSDDETTYAQADEGGWTVTGWVDAATPSGGTVRSDYGCTTIRVADSDQYRSRVDYLTPRV